MCLDLVAAIEESRANAFATPVRVNPVSHLSHSAVPPFYVADAKVIDADIRKSISGQRDPVLILILRSEIGISLAAG